MDLLRIIPGPPAIRDGHRLLLTLRFTDRVLLRVEHPWTDDLPEWELADDLGTVYDELTYNGDDDGAAISFTPGVPGAAAWVELALGDLAFRVPMDAPRLEPVERPPLTTGSPGPAADLRTMARRGAARQVFVPDRVEHAGGLAIVAVIASTDATEVVFHHAGEPREHPAPTLRDDRGTVYTPVAATHVGSYGIGADALTGLWRYQPPAPDAAAAFDAGGRRLR